MRIVLKKITSNNGFMKFIPRLIFVRLRWSANIIIECTELKIFVLWFLIQNSCLYDKSDFVLSYMSMISNQKWFKFFSWTVYFLSNLFFSGGWMNSSYFEYNVEKIYVNIKRSKLFCLTLAYFFRFIWILFSCLCKCFLHTA